MLGQAFAHCPIFPTAASRRSLDRVSVPMWPITLSGRLPIAGLVGRYLTNYLIGRELTPNRISPFTPRSCDLVVLCGISRCFHLLSPCLGQIAHALLTRPPLEYQPSGRNLPINIPARLACVKHAASVRPEPGSNSDVQSLSCLISASESTRQSQSLFLIQQAFHSFESDCFLYSLSSLSVSFSRIVPPQVTHSLTACLV